MLRQWIGIQLAWMSCFEHLTSCPSIFHFIAVSDSDHRPLGNLTFSFSTALDPVVHHRFTDLVSSFSRFSLQVDSSVSDTSDSDSVSASVVTMAATDDDKRAYIQLHVASDLQYVWEDSAITLETQYKLAEHYRSLRVFVSIGDTPAEIRTALANDFQVDPAASAANRAEVARVVSAWTVGKQLHTKETELQAESKVLGMPRILQHSERLAMLKAVETQLGTLSDKDTPSAEYLAMKTEEIESGEIVASGLDEMTSKVHKNTSTLQTSLDQAGHVRVTKTKVKGAMPSSTEEYRQAMKVEATTWLCMAVKFKSKHYLNGLKAEHFQQFVDFVLGDKIHGIKVPMDGQQQSLRPSWALVLQFEHKLRREAFKLVNRGECTLSAALKQVVGDMELKESYFTTPLALLTAEGQMPQKYNRPNSKGGNDGRGFQGGYHYRNDFNNKKGGKGKQNFGGKGKSKHKGSHGNLQLATHTPDGRELCFAYNSQGCKGQCGRVHACRVRGCYADHSAREHDRIKGLNKEAKDNKE